MRCNPSTESLLYRFHGHVVVGDARDESEQNVLNTLPSLSSVLSLSSHIRANAAATVTPSNSVAAVCNSIGGAGDVTVEPSAYVETSGVNVQGALTITSEDRTGCTFTKTDNGAFVLFTVSASGANLTITNLTLLLTNHSDSYNFVRVTGSAAVCVTVSECHIGMGVGLSTIYGRSFYVDNDMATLGFESCTVCGITCSNYAFIYLSDIDTIYVTDSSFASMQNSVSSGCFDIPVAKNLTLTQSQFVGCTCRNDGYRGGVGNIWCLKANGSAILACTFWSDTAYYAGVISFGSNPAYCATLMMANTSCLRCTASWMGGALYLIHYFDLTLTDCSFADCLGANGGVFVCEEYSSMSIARCTFVGCTSISPGSPQNVGGWGGGVGYINISSVSVEYSVFIGNSASSGWGDDFSVWESSTLAINMGVYTDATTVSSSIFIASYGSPTTLAGSGVMQVGGAYGSATCAGAFSATGLDAEGYCRMPCAASGGGCVKPDACPIPGDIAMTGRCVEASYDGASCMCPYQEHNEFNNNTGVCELKDCTSRGVNSMAFFPCGTNDCTPNGDTGLCRIGCAFPEHYENSTVTEVCELKNCVDRRVGNTAKFPCGSSDCIPDGDTGLCKANCNGNYCGGCISAETCNVYSINCVWSGSACSSKPAPIDPPPPVPATTNTNTPSSLSDLLSLFANIGSSSSSNPSSPENTPSITIVITNAVSAGEHIALPPFRAMSGDSGTVVVLGAGAEITALTIGDNSYAAVADAIPSPSPTKPTNACVTVSTGGSVYLSGLSLVFTEPTVLTGSGGSGDPLTTFAVVDGGSTFTINGTVVTTANNNENDFPSCFLYFESGTVVLYTVAFENIAVGTYFITLPIGTSSDLTGTGANAGNSFQLSSSSLANITLSSSNPRPLLYEPEATSGRNNVIINDVVIVNVTVSDGASARRRSVKRAGAGAGTDTYSGNTAMIYHSRNNNADRKVVIGHGTFSNIIASDYFYAPFVIDGTTGSGFRAIFEDVSLFGNEALYAGALFVAANTVVELTNCVFYDNLYKSPLTGYGNDISAIGAAPPPVLTGSCSKSWPPAVSVGGVEESIEVCDGDYPRLKANIVRGGEETERYLKKEKSIAGWIVLVVVVAVVVFALLVVGFVIKTKVMDKRNSSIVMNMSSPTIKTPASFPSTISPLRSNTTTSMASIMKASSSAQRLIHSSSSASVLKASSSDD